MLIPKVLEAITFLLILINARNYINCILNDLRDTYIWRKDEQAEKVLVLVIWI